MVKCGISPNGRRWRKRESDYIFPFPVGRNMGNYYSISIFWIDFLNFTEFLVPNTNPYSWFIRLVVHILLTNASNKELTLHLHQHMNQIQLPINIPAIRLEMMPINTMSLHFQTNNSNREEVFIIFQPDSFR